MFVVVRETFTAERIWGLKAIKMSAKQNSLGRSIIKNHSRRKRVILKEGHRHSSDLHDGRDWGRLNLRSVTEHTSLDDFLDRVQLADKEYSEEFHNVQLISPDVANGTLSEAEKLTISDAQKKLKDLLRIPRRPHWDRTSTKEELDRNENESFLNWRRSLALLNEEEHINLTPYEKNLEVWRQLWRVIEKSDVVVQIIDSRNPLLFRCEDLESYVKETDEKKLNVLLLNKSDFLTLKQREIWAEYFSNIGVQVVFFSALQQMQKIDEIPEDDDEPEEHEDETEVQNPVQDEHSDEEEIPSPHDTAKEHGNHNEFTVCNDSRLLSREELIVFLKNLGQKVQSDPVTTIGLVGYPNVGKSSTINAVMLSKKVSVSSTPGKTKHFQTMMVDPELCFCDCPGLVFPNFVSTKAEMVVNGILPIDQLTSYIPPVTLVASLIPRKVLESTYSITLPFPGENEDPSRSPTAEELLNAHGYMRGFMTHRGLPDTARSARYILKDYVNGKLLYCHSPPGFKHEEYQDSSYSGARKPKVSVQSALHEDEMSYVDFDEEFFHKEDKAKRRPQETENQQTVSGMHAKNLQHAERMIRGNKYIGHNPELGNPIDSKAFKKHHNRNKREKLRRVHAHLDQ